MTLRLLVAPKGGPEIASSRYRVHALVPLLRERGWEVELLTPSRSAPRRLAALLGDLRLAASPHDVLLVQRPGWRREESLVLRVAASRARVVVVDVDDPVDLTGLTRWAVRRAQLALVVSRALEAAYAGLVPRVARVPTSIDLAPYADVVPAGELVVGWIGDGRSYGDALVRMVSGVGAAPLPLRLRIVGTLGDARLERRLAGAAGPHPLELVPALDWQDERAVAREIGTFSVGLAPFRDTHGGSFKTVQYLAAGVVPIVESGGEAEHHALEALGADALVVEPGSAPQLRRALELLGDPDTRSRLAERCRRAARAYDRGAVAALVDRELRRAVSQAAAPGRRLRAPARDARERGA